MRKQKSRPEASEQGHSEKRYAEKRRSVPAALCSVLSALILTAVLAVCVPMTVPRLFGYDVYTVVSGSMEPDIPIGSAIYVEAVAPEEVAAGDVIAFYSRGAVITHRVVENRVVSGEFVTKGDANAENDMETAGYEMLVGRMAVSVPVLGSIMAVCSETTGKLYLVCGVVGAVLLRAAGSLLGKEAASR